MLRPAHLGQVLELPLRGSDALQDVRLLRVLWPGEELAHLGPPPRGRGLALSRGHFQRMSYRCRREEKKGEWGTRRNGTPTGYANSRWGGTEVWDLMIVCMGASGHGWGTCPGWIALDRRRRCW